MASPVSHTLNRMNSGDFEYFQKLTPEEMKELPAPYVLMMFARGAEENNHYHTMLTNIYVNSKVFSLYRHQKLLYLLLTEANSLGDDTRYRFVKDEKETAGKDVKAVQWYLQCSEVEASMYVRLFISEDELKEIMKMKEEAEK